MAEHFSQSTEAADLEKAVHYGQLAARRSVAVFDYGEAARWLEQALRAHEVLDGNALTRCDLLLELIRPLSMIGEPVRATQEVAEEAFQIADAAGDRARALTAFRLADEAMSRHGRAWPFPGREIWSERGDKLALPGTVDRVYADIALGFTSGNSTGSTQSGLETAPNDVLGDVAWSYRKRGFELALKLGDTPALFRAGLFAVIHAGFRYREWPSSIAMAEQALAWPRDGVASVQIGEVFWHTSNIFYEHGDIERCREIERETALLGERAQDSDQVQFASFMKYRLLFHSGDIEGALDQAVEMGNRARERNAPWFIALGALLQLLPRLYLDRDLAGALSRLPDQLPGVEEPLAKALFLAHLGRVNEARSALGQFENSVNGDYESGIETNWGRGNMALETANLIGERDVAAKLEVLLTGFDQALDRFINRSVARLLGKAALLRGDSATARTHFETGIDLCNRVAFRPEVALTRLDLAELLLDHYPDEHDAAIEHLDFAIAEFREMKMQPALERALGRRGLLKA